MKLDACNLLIYCIISTNIIPLLASSHQLYANLIKNYFPARRWWNGRPPPLIIPEKPGAALIKPRLGMLKSSAQYPSKDQGEVVYGNIDNLSIAYGKTPQRIMYSGFRKSNRHELLNAILLALVQSVQHQTSQSAKINNENSLQNENSREIMDHYSKDLKSPSISRRQTNRNITNKEITDVIQSKYKDIEHFKKDFSDFQKYLELGPEEEDSEEEEESDSEPEKNPGNPFTIHKNKYLKNYLWNFKMDGDHVNINPFAPEPHGAKEPSGDTLIFNRKWWYFNQTALTCYGSNIQALSQLLRRLLDYSYDKGAGVLGVPTEVEHLPLAEVIQPGLTLIRPAFSSLKSALKFPHKDYPTVYGNYDNLGLKYGNTNDRVLYTKFRRNLQDYIMLAPVKDDDSQTRILLKAITVDLNKDNNIKRNLLNLLEKLVKPQNQVQNTNIYVADLSSMPTRASRKTNYLEPVSLELLTTPPSDLQMIEPLIREKKNKIFDIFKNKYKYDHIRIKNEAIDLQQMIPKEYKLDNLRNWWFYNQDDYTPLATRVRRMSLGAKKLLIGLFNKLRTR